MIQRNKDDIEKVGEISPDGLLGSSVIKYNNLVKQVLCNREESKDTKIIELTTKLKELQTFFTTSFSASMSKKALPYSIIHSS